MNGSSRLQLLPLVFVCACVLGCSGADEPGLDGEHDTERAASADTGATTPDTAQLDARDARDTKGEHAESSDNASAATDTAAGAQPAGRDTGRPPAGGVSGGRDVERETLVVAEPLKRGAIRDEILVSARVESRVTVQVFPKLSGLPVTEVLAEEGELVKTGELLMRLYDDELRITEQERASQHTQALKEIDRARVQLEEDEARIVRAERQAQKAGGDLLRLTGLANEKLVNQQEVDDARLMAETAVDDLGVARKTRDRSAISLELAEIAARQAELQWQRAKADLSHAEVRAPISGVVSERNAEIGELSSGSAPAFVVVDLGQPVLNLRVPQDSLARLAVGQRVETSAVTLPGTFFEGVVRNVNPVLDQSTGSVHVIVDLVPQPDLLPGLFCQARVITAARSNALLVDKRAVLHTDGLPHVFVLSEEGTSVRKLSFQPGSSTALATEMLADAEGEPVPDDLRVVVVGQENLKDGGRVRLQDTAY